MLWVSLIVVNCAHFNLVYVATKAFGELVLIAVSKLPLLCCFHFWFPPIFLLFNWCGSYRHRFASEDLEYSF